MFSVTFFRRTNAFFQSDGNELCLSEAVKYNFRQGDTSTAKVFSNLEGMRSGPEGSSSLSNLAIPATSNSIDGIS